MDFDMDNVLKETRGERALEIPKWTWAEDQFEENHWVEVRKTFSIKNAGASAILNISVDTDYCAWLNGQFIGTGQFSDYPRDKHYDSLNIGSALKNGTNVLCILAFYQGRSTSRYRRGKAGLIFWLNSNTDSIISDKLTKTRTSPAYLSGPIDVVSGQLGFTISYNANMDDNWLLTRYNDANWSNAVELGTRENSFWQKLSVRPLPMLEIQGALKSKVIKAGRLVRQKAQPDSFAKIMAADTLFVDDSFNPFTFDRDQTQTSFAMPSPRYNEDGSFIILDMGAEVFGFLEIELTCESGCVIDIAHGEHICDGRVRCSIHNRNFADRYVSKDGYQKWQMPMRRLGCRYIEVHITCQSKPVIVNYVGICPVIYPVTHRGEFRCSEEIYNRIYDVSKRTLELCMHEHYEDCPWREQALYAMDSRIQALCGYYAFGEYAFPEESLRLLGKGIREDGFLELTAPAEVSLTIPCFSMIWVTEILQHFLYSGSRKLINEFLAQMKSMLQSYVSRMDETGLMPLILDPQYWNFYEWSPGLDGCDRSDEKSRHCCLNLFLLEAIDSLGQICSLAGDPDAEQWFCKAEELRKNIHEVFFDNQHNLFKNSTSGKEGQFSQLTQALALAGNVTTAEQSENLRMQIVQNCALIPATLSMSIFVYDALLKNSMGYGQDVLKDIRQKWGHMLEQGATSFWETIKGQADFDGAGSLCHGWSAVPLYVFHAYVLGIRPLTPGFKKFHVNPAVNLVNCAHGTVPTPAGDIKLHWDMKNSDWKIFLQYPTELQVEIPENLKNRIICESI